jgi:hypothetical protein
MTMPQAYEPEQGYRYQILTRYQNQPWEHCDYAKDRQEKNYLLKEYRMAYSSDMSFKVIELPMKYWKED